ncbi:uncharacterized protein LOC127571914 [Pristis pectinata]|uniref:uncharacterized protein LOC127571914 n=1 Tax=Pristis pectinata TaxID=685728 RepID=UPI00223D0686|nr:uncharacterized protein LOC127571914 [Pristis pectinata]
MQIFRSVNPEEPDPLPPTDWEGGYFCQHVAVFVLFYFSCMVAFLASYSSFLQIYNSVRTVVRSCGKLQSSECDSTPPQSFSLLCLLGALRKQVGRMLRAVFSQRASRKLRKRFRHSLERIVPQGKLRLKHLRPGGRCRKHRIQYLQSAGGEVLCYLPRKVLEYPHLTGGSEGIYSYGHFNFVDVCKSKYKAGSRYIRSSREQVAGKKSPSSATFEIRPELRPRLQSPICNYKRANFI